MKSVQNANSFDDIYEIADRYKSALGQYPLNLRRTSGVSEDPRGTLHVIISKTNRNFLMSFEICLKHLKICH